MASPLTRNGARPNWKHSTKDFYLSQERSDSLLTLKTIRVPRSELSFSHAILIRFPTWLSQLTPMRRISYAKWSLLGSKVLSQLSLPPCVLW